MIKINPSETATAARKSSGPFPSPTAPQQNKRQSGIHVENYISNWNSHAQGLGQEGQVQGQGQGQGRSSVLPYNRTFNEPPLITDKHKYPKRVSLRSSSELALAIRSCNSNRNSNNNTRNHQNGKSQPQPPGSGSGSGSTRGGNYLYREMPTMINLFNDPPLSFGSSAQNAPSSLSSSNSHPVQRQCNLQNRSRNVKRPSVGKGNGRRSGISPTRTVAGQFLSNTNSRSRFSRPTQRQRQLATNTHSPHQQLLARNLNTNDDDHSSRSRSPRPGFGFRWKSPSLTRFRSKSSRESFKCNAFNKHKQQVQPEERTRKLIETSVPNSKSEFEQRRRPEFEFKFKQKEQEVMSPAKVIPTSASPVCTSTFPRGKFKTFKFQNKPETEQGTEGKIQQDNKMNPVKNITPDGQYCIFGHNNKLMQNPKINIIDVLQNFQRQNRVFNNSMFENSDDSAAEQGPFNNRNRQKEVELQSAGTTAAALPLKASAKLSQSLQGFHLVGGEEADTLLKKDAIFDTLNCTKDSNIISNNSCEMSNYDEFCHMEKLAEALSKSKPTVTALAATENKNETDENNNDLKRRCVLYEFSPKELQNVELPLKETPISKESKSGSLPIELLEKKAKFQYEMLQECAPIIKPKIKDITLDINGNTEFNLGQKSMSRLSSMVEVSVAPITCNTPIISSSLLSPESKSNLLADVKGRIRQLELLKQFSDLEVETLRKDLSNAKLLIARQSVQLEELKPNEGPPWNVPSDENNNNTSTKNVYNPNVDYFSFRTFDDADISHLIPGKVFQAQVVPSFKLKAKTPFKQKPKSNISHVTRLMKEKETALTSSKKRMNQIKALKENLQSFARPVPVRVPELTSAGQPSLSPSKSSKPSSRPTYQIRTKSAPPGKTYLNIYHRKIERERTFEVQSSNNTAHNQNKIKPKMTVKLKKQQIIKNVNFQTELKPWDKSSAKYINGSLCKSSEVEAEVNVESQFQFRSKSLPRNSKLYLFSTVVEPKSPETVSVALKNKRSSCTHKIADAHAHLYGGSINQNNGSVEYLAIAVASREGLIREIAHSIKKAKRILHFRFNALISSSDISIKDLHFLLTSHRRFIRWLHNYVNYSMALMSRFDDKCMKSAHFFVPSTISLDGRTTVKGIFIPLPEPGPRKAAGPQSQSLKSPSISLKTTLMKSEPDGHPQVLCGGPTPNITKAVATFTTTASTSTSTSSLLTEATVERTNPAQDVVEFKPQISQLPLPKPKPKPIIQKTYGTQTQNPSVVSASSDPIPIPIPTELDPPKSNTNIGTQAALKPPSQDFSNSFTSIFSSYNESTHKIKVVDATNNTDAGTHTEDTIQTSVDCCKQKNTFSEQNLSCKNETINNFSNTKPNLKPVPVPEPEPKPAMHNDSMEIQEFFDCSATSSRNSVLEVGSTATGTHATNIQMEIQEKFQNQTDFAGIGNHHVNSKFKIPPYLNSDESDFLIHNRMPQVPPVLCKAQPVESETVIPSLSARNVALAAHALVINTDGYGNSTSIEDNISNCVASASSSHSMKSINSNLSPSPTTSRSKPRIILHIHDLDTSIEMRENIVEEEGSTFPSSPPGPHVSNRRKSSCAANFLINKDHVREGNLSDEADAMNVFENNSKSKPNFLKETNAQDLETIKASFEFDTLYKSESDLENNISLQKLSKLGSIFNNSIAETAESAEAEIGGLNNEIELAPDLNNNFVEVQNKVFSPHSCPSVTSPQNFQSLQFNKISTAILTQTLPEKDPEASKCVLNFSSFGAADADAFNNNFLPEEMNPTMIDQIDTEAALKDLKTGPLSPLDFLDAQHFEDAAKFYNHKGNLDMRALDPGKYNIKIPIVPDNGCPICRRKQESLLHCKNIPRPRTPTVEEFTNFFEQTVQKYKENQGNEDSLKQYKTAAQVILDILNGKAKDKNLNNPKFVKSSHAQQCCTHPRPGSNNGQRKIEINNPIKTKSKICANFENKMYTKEEKKSSVQKLHKNSVPIVPMSSNKSKSNKSITGNGNQSKVSVADVVFLSPKSPKTSSAVQIKKVQTLPKLSVLTGAGNTETKKQKIDQRPQSACLDDPRKLKQKLENCSLSVKTKELRPASASAACSSRQSRLPVPVPILGVTKLQPPTKTDVFKNRAVFLKISDSNTSVSTPQQPQPDATLSNNVQNENSGTSKPMAVVGSSKPSFITTQIAKVGAKMRQSFIPVKTVKPDTMVATSLVATATKLPNITQDKKVNHARQIPVKRHFKPMPTSYNAIDPDKVNLKTEAENVLITNTNTISKDSNKLLLTTKTNTRANSTVMKKSSFSKLWGSKTKSNLESSRAKVKGNNVINVVPTSHGPSLLLGPKKFSCDLKR